STYGISYSYEGIYLSACVDTVSIKNNRFDLENGGAGIYILTQQFNDSSRYFITNNAVIMSGNGKSQGIYIASYENTKVYCIHNTVRISKGNSENNGFALKNS